MNRILRHIDLETDDKLPLPASIIHMEEFHYTDGDGFHRIKLSIWYWVDKR